MTHSDSTSPSLGGFGSPQEDDIISLGPSNCSSSSASTETADPATPNPSPFVEAYSGAKRYHSKPYKSAFPPPVDQHRSSNDEEAGHDSETHSTRTNEMVDDEKLAEEITNFLHQLKSDWASAKDQNTRIQELLEEQSKRSEEVYNKVLQQEAASHVLNEALQQEAVIHREFTDGLLNRVSQLETTLANLTLQKTPSDIHVDVHMPPQQSSSTTVGDAPPRRSPHDEESSDGRSQSSLSLKPSLNWTEGLLMYLAEPYCLKDTSNIMRTFREAKSMSQSDPSACRDKIYELGGHLEAFVESREHMGNRHPQTARCRSQSSLSLKHSLQDGLNWTEGLLMYLAEARVGLCPEDSIKT
ncbi:hypothetical protein B9479_006259 [Cryptococcus floricola]|uniref:Uncharacterized protein n=1 Tax=Cryptococcus floricola TaxID=2591691 RepID=A0A5D3ATQ1_9TREE|nr:hypothetical protein B9479_006259 [Cryptococcus floricola]